MRRAPLARRTPLRRTPLRQRSAKRARLYRTTRAPLVAALLAEPQPCPVPGCTRVADSPHEPLTRARGGSITDPDNVVAVCWAHNQELTLEPAWGYASGLLRHSWDGPEVAA